MSVEALSEARLIDCINRCRAAVSAKRPLPFQTAVVQLADKIATYEIGVAEYEKTVKNLESLVYVPGLFRCAKCKFQLNKIEIHAHSGNMRADNTPDSCPNCESPLWRVTERDAGNDVCDRLHAAVLNLCTISDSWRETMIECLLLKDVWEHASDMIMAEKNEQFAAEHGTVQYFKEKLVEAINKYEQDYQENEDMNDKTRITYNMLDMLIEKEYYFTADEGVVGSVGPSGNLSSSEMHPSLRLHTFCVLMMKSGTTITGESCCADPENFNAERGRAVARSRAMTKAFELEGYRLATERKATMGEDN